MNADSHTSNRPIRLAIVEDDDLFRDLLRMALASIPGISVIADFGDADKAEAELPRLKPDVLLLDINLGKGRNGVQLGLSLRRVLPEVGILLFSNHREPDFLLSVPTEQAGGWSYLLKTSVRDVATLERAIRGSAAGLVVLDPRLAAGFRSPVDGPALSERQISLIQLIAQGFSNKGIAARLGLSEKTVENQLGILYRELGLDTSDSETHARVRAALLYLRGIAV
ncbi:response regulator transcription factor [bacterium]|nr:response regulator transcription factor [bacterium]